MVKNSKVKNCKKGYPCGQTCINKERNCKNALKGQAASFADWLKQSATLSTPRSRDNAAVSAEKGNSPSPTFVGKKYNPYAIEDLSISDFKNYLEFKQAKSLNNRENEQLRADGESAASQSARKRVASKIKQAINRGIIIDDDLITQFEVKLNKQEQAGFKSNQAEFQRQAKKASVIKQAIDHPLMDEKDIKGHKPSMTREEAANYTRGSFADGISFYHGNPSSVTDSMANEGVKPELNDRGIFGKGAYFAASKNVAENYANAAMSNQDGDFGVVEIKTKVKNPYVIDSAEIKKISASFIGTQSNLTDSTAIQEFIKAKGYDSVYLQDFGYYISFDGKQNVVVDNEKISKNSDRAKQINSQWSVKLKDKSGGAIRVSTSFEWRVSSRSPSAKAMKQAKINSEKLKQLVEPFEVLNLDDL